MAEYQKKPCLLNVQSELELRRARSREYERRKKFKRLNEPPEKTEHRKRINRERKRMKRQIVRMNETPDEALIRKFTERERKRKSREQQKLAKEKYMNGLVDSTFESDCDDEAKSDLSSQNVPLQSDPFEDLSQIDPVEDPLNIPEPFIKES